MEYTPEMIKTAKRAESAEALLALAKKNGYEMTTEEAEAYFARMHKSGELSDEELENVSGGGCRNNGHLVVTTMYGCDLWLCKKDKRKARPTGYITTDTNRPYATCPSCGRDPYCKDCYYCHYEKGLWLCYNPEK